MTGTTTKRFLVEYDSPLDNAFGTICGYLDNPPTPDRTWSVLGVIDTFAQAIAADTRMAGWFDDLNTAAAQLTAGSNIDSYSDSYSDSDGLAVLRRYAERYEELVTVASPLQCLLDRLLREHTQDGRGVRSDHWRGTDYADGFDAGIEFAVEQIRNTINGQERS